MKKRILSLIAVFALCIFIFKPIKTSASVTAVAGSVVLGLIFGEMLNGSTSEVIGGLIERGGEGIDFLMNKDGVFDEWVENNLFNTIAEYDEEQHRIKSLTMSLDDFDEFQEHVLSLFGATAENNYTTYLDDYNFKYIQSSPSPAITIHYGLDRTADIYGKYIYMLGYYDDDFYLFTNGSSANYIRTFFDDGNPKVQCMNLAAGLWDYEDIVSCIFSDDFKSTVVVYNNDNKETHDLGPHQYDMLYAKFQNADGEIINSVDKYIYFVSETKITDLSVLRDMSMTNRAISANKGKLRDVVAPVLDFPGVNADDVTISFPIIGEGDMPDVIVGTDTVSVTLDKLLEAELDTDIDLDLDIDMPDVIIRKFPFSLPFDFHRIMTIFVASPEAPKFEIPFKMDGVFDYTVTIDLSEFEWLAEIVRFFVWLVFVVILIFATRKLVWK